MKNNMKKVLSMLLAVLMMASMSTAAFAEEEKEFTGDSITGNIDFYYTVTQEDVYTDFSGVKLSWSVPVVKYTETDTRTWDTTNLKWVQTKSATTTDNEVSFTLTNRGSYAVKANVSFTPEVEDSASVNFGTTNDPTLATIVKDDHSLQVTKTEDQTDEQFATAKSDYVTNNCSATIKGTVSLDANKLSTASGKLGTYTVSIRNTVHTVTVEYWDENGVKQQSSFTVADGTIITLNGCKLIDNCNNVSVTTVDKYSIYEFGSYKHLVNEEVSYLVDGSSITVTSDLTLTAEYTA